jgi:hypothetical protein
MSVIQQFGAAVVDRGLRLGLFTRELSCDGIEKPADFLKPIETSDYSGTPPYGPPARRSLSGISGLDFMHSLLGSRWAN